MSNKNNIIKRNTSRKNKKTIKINKNRNKNVFKYHGLPHELSLKYKIDGLIKSKNNAQVGGVLEEWKLDGYPIAKGSYGRVYSLRIRPGEDERVLKKVYFMKPMDVVDFGREVEVMKTVQNAVDAYNRVGGGIISLRIYDYGIDGDEGGAYGFIVMNRFPNSMYPALYGVGGWEMKEVGGILTQLTPAHQLRIIRDVAEQAWILEDLGIAHNDIKPDNIVFTSIDSPRAALIDYGLASRSSNGIVLAEPGGLQRVSGTAQYLPHDYILYNKFKSTPPPNKCHDAWAIGMVCLELGFVNFAKDQKTLLKLTDPDHLEIIKEMVKEFFEIHGDQSRLDSFKEKIFANTGSKLNSNTLKVLIYGILQENVNDRFGLTKILNVIYDALGVKEPHRIWNLRGAGRQEIKPITIPQWTAINEEYSKIGTELFPGYQSANWNAFLDDTTAKIAQPATDSAQPLPSTGILDRFWSFLPTFGAPLPAAVEPTRGQKRGRNTAHEQLHRKSSRKDPDLAIPLGLGVNSSDQAPSNRPPSWA